MRVDQIEMKGFASHKYTRLKFPAKGLVLVSGANGAGKSSMIDAVSVAGWGRSLRGKGRGVSLWSDSKAGVVSIKTSDVSIARSATGKLSWSYNDPAKDVVKYESKTKSLEALHRLIGDQVSWSRTNVFSSHDASTFSTAPDSERKRLIETLRGIDTFDAASDRCRKDLKAALAKEQATVQELAVLQERVAQLQARVTDAEQGAGQLEVRGKVVSPEDVPRLRAKLAARVRELKARVDAYPSNDAVNTARVAYERARAALEHAQAHRPRSGACPTCGQTWPQSRKTAPKSLEELRAATGVARQALKAATERAEAEATLRKVAQEKLHSAQWDLDQVGKWSELHARATKRLTALREEAFDAEDNLIAAQTVLAEIQARVALLRAADRVLGLNGVRTVLLEDALSSVEQVANVWLQRVASVGDYGARLSLKPYSTNAKGGVKDAISMTIEGMGNGQGYYACSGGERRRIDVALVLALAEVVAGARGTGSGTLFFDEVFDALDADGQGSVCTVLEEMAQTCCVVVITHRKDLVQLLRPLAAVCWHVDGGKVHESATANAATRGS